MGNQKAMTIKHLRTLGATPGATLGVAVFLHLPERPVALIPFTLTDRAARTG
jgi:hypothetical protein